MSNTTARILLWVVGVICLVGLVYSGHKSFATPGMLNWEFLAFVVFTTAYTKCIRVDENISIEMKSKVD